MRTLPTPLDHQNRRKANHMSIMQNSLLEQAPSRKMTDKKEPETKTCPYCKEEIKKDAIRCKHCKKDLIQKNRSWKPIALGCLYVFFGLVNLLVALLGAAEVYGASMGEVGSAVFLIFGVMFFGVSYGFFARKQWSLKWGYATAVLNVLADLWLGVYFGVIVWAFALWLVHSSRAELVE